MCSGKPIYTPPISQKSTQCFRQNSFNVPNVSSETVLTQVWWTGAVSTPQPHTARTDLDVCGHQRRPHRQAAGCTKWWSAGWRSCSCLSEWSEPAAAPATTKITDCSSLSVWPDAACHRKQKHRLTALPFRMIRCYIYTWNKSTDWLHWMNSTVTQ